MFSVTVTFKVKFMNSTESLNPKTLKYYIVTGTLPGNLNSMATMPNERL